MVDGGWWMVDGGWWMMLVGGFKSIGKGLRERIGNLERRIYCWYFTIRKALSMAPKSSPLSSARKDGWHGPIGANRLNLIRISREDQGYSR
jgi:hypothetical protein